MENNRYSLWDSIGMFQKCIKFDVLEQKIVTFSEFVKKGMAKNQIQKALETGKVNFKASFKDLKGDEHMISLIDVEILGDKVVGKTASRSFITTADILIDDKSIFTSGKVVLPAQLMESII